MTTNLNTKKNVLIFIDWFWPSYLAGGPIQSIVSIIHYLNQEFNFYIITSNVDLNKEPLKDISPNKWIDSPLGCKVFYAEPSTLNYAKTKSIISEIDFDVVYINSFFSKFYSITPLFVLKKYYNSKKIILAPRGMLGDGALSIKPFKKKLFFVFAKFFNIHKNITWQATSEQEQKEIEKRIGSNAKIQLVSNLPKIITETTPKTKSEGILKLCFVSRISSKKNIKFAIEILNNIKKFQIEYNIYGPIEDIEYWNQCLQTMSNQPSNIKVLYKGTLKPNEIESVYKQNDALFLPSLNENFGHAIVESLLCGCPVIISDQTPWTDIEEHNAGFSIDLNNHQAFEDAIVYLANLNQTKYSKLSLASKKYINSKINISQTIALYKKLFNEHIKN